MWNICWIYLNCYKTLLKLKNIVRCLICLLTQKKEELASDIDKKLFDLLKNISSLSMKILDDGAEFVPYLTIGGERTFGVQDISDDDYNLLSHLELSKLPLNLTARVADVLWLKKRDYKAANIAHKAYY